MTIEEKAKAYDEALVKAREIHRNVVEKRFDMEWLFPELKESEDERVKKRILLSLEKDLMATKNSGCDTQDLKQCIAWLEKQDDTTSDIRYDGVNAGGSLSIVNGKPFDYEKATITQKDFAPKPTEWSEEDERICQCLIKDQEESLDEVRNDKYGHSEIISDLKEMYRERINWLKSLKDRMKGKEEKK